MQMRDTARASLLSLPTGANTGGTNSARSTLYSRDGFASDESHAPMLQASGKGGSGLRHQQYAESWEGDSYDNHSRENEGMRHRGQY